MKVAELLVKSGVMSEAHSFVSLIRSNHMCRLSDPLQIAYLFVKSGVMNKVHSFTLFRRSNQRYCLSVSSKLQSYLSRLES